MNLALCFLIAPNSALTAAKKGHGSQHKYPHHPRNKKKSNDGTDHVDDPITRSFWFPKVKHAAMVALLILFDAGSND
jgi:hypothetical protein